MPIEVDWESKDLRKLKESGFQNTAFEHSLMFVNVLKSTNNPVKLHRPMPSPISENNAASKKQEIDFSILQSFV